MQHSSLKRPRRRPGENRERLLISGIQEFAVRGYRGASTASIAASAGVPQPHVYASFRTKRDLFVACANRVVENILENPSPEARIPESSTNLFIFQAFAALGERELSDELKPLLNRLNAELGQRVIEDRVLSAVRALL